MEKQKTERLRFHRISVDDAPFILELLNEPGYIQNIGDRDVHSLAAAREFIQQRMRYTNDGLGFYRITVSSDNESIGIAGIIQRDFLDAPDLGYALLARFEGRGYATEAARAVLSFATHELRAERVGAIISKGNDASVRIVKKLGMRLVREIKYPGETGPVLYFECTPLGSAGR